MRSEKRAVNADSNRRRKPFRRSATLCSLATEVRSVNDSVQSASFCVTRERWDAMGAASQ